MAAIARHPRLTGAISLFLLLTLTYSFSVGLRATTGASITGDEPFYLLTTQGLIDDGDLDLTQQYERESYRSFFDHPSGLWRQSVEMDDGRLLSPHEPGLSVLVIPGFLLDGLRGVQVQLMLLAALTFSLAFVLTSLETGMLRLSWLVTAAVGLSASVFVYSTEVYPELPAALCLVLSLLLVRTRPGGAWAGLGLALTLTALMWFGLKYAPLAALVTIPFLLGADLRGRVALIAAGAVSAAFYVWFHYAVFDDLTAYSVNTVYEGADAVSVFESHVAFQERIYRLWGLLIDQRFGIGRWAPFLLLLAPALPLLLKQGRMGLTVFGLIGAQVLIATFVAITMMGWWFPGRTLMVVAPLFPLALVPLISRLPVSGRAVAGVLALTSVAFTAALQRAGATHEVRLAVDPFDMSWAPFRWSANLFPNYQAWSTETVILTALWLAVFGLAIGAVVWTAFRGEIDAVITGLHSRRVAVGRGLTLRRG
ncbi:MAG TPA: hypothetical protein VG845_02385 [Dehalococcoidia bacterium]|nr:hypothetical protein [Dehalococcoidia bacterium]